MWKSDKKLGLNQEFHTLPQNIRDDFPSLQKQVYGKRYAFLDSAASSLKPAPVIKKMSDFLLGDYANIHRGLYHDSMRATEGFERARHTLSKFFGLELDTDILVFTKGATEAINLVAEAVLRPRLQSGDVILLTVMEHHANIVPWQMVAKHTGAQLKYIEPDEDGCIDLAVFEAACKKWKPKIASFNYVSNVLGTINPIYEMTQIAHQEGVSVLVDAAQAGMHLPFQFHDVGADFMVVSGHKMLGPTGIGALITKRDILDASEPYQFGGEMILEVDYDSSTWNELPYKFEAGTPPIAEAIGWEAASQYLDALGWEAIRNHEIHLLKHASDLFHVHPKVTVYGPKDVRQISGVISFNIEGIHAHDVGTILDRQGVAVRVGHHCAQLLMRHFGVEATVRMSVGVYNNHEDIEQLCNAIEYALKIFNQ